MFLILLIFEQIFWSLIHLTDFADLIFVEVWIFAIRPNKDLIKL